MQLYVPPNADRLLVVISDIEMGAGGPTDDFPHTAFLADLIRRYTQPPYDTLKVEMVFNGDTFDLLKTALDERYPRAITAAIAKQKFDRVLAVHGPFFDALRDFVSHGDNVAHFIVGNHDFELLFADVQDAIRERVDPTHPDRIQFPGFELDIGEVHIEHGNQADPLFMVDERRLFIDHHGESILNLPWGCTAVIDVALPLQPYLYHLDRLKPRKQVFNLLPEVKELIISAYWKYWTRDYWGDFLRGRDPTKTVSWTMFREIVGRFSTQNPDLDVGERYQRALTATRGHELTLIGHLHQPAWWSYAGRKLLQTGCFRDEYRLLGRTGGLKPIPKVYAEVYLKGDVLVRSQLVELEGPPAPEGHMPDDIFAVVAAVLPLLGTPGERAADARAQEQQERREARQHKKSR
ncbi:MAG: hypothetical protein AAFV53_02845 [Myxococcota bacterium]